MSTNAKPGIGAVFRRWAVESIDSTTGIWKDLVEVTNIGWGGISREVIETFKLNNEDDYVNKLQGILNAGSVTLTINYTREQYFDLKAEMEIRGNQQYQLELPDGEALEFEGFITELPLDIGSDDVMQGDITIEIDGRPDFVSAAAGSPS
jgi:hypothetical protein